MASSDDDIHDWTLAGLRRVIFALLDERDRRYEQRFADQTTAIHKAEIAVEKRFESVNELRGALDDTSKLQMPRTESNARYDSLIGKIDEHVRQDSITHANIMARIEALAHRIDLREGEQLGGKDNKESTRATWALAIAVIAVLIQVVVLVFRK